MSLGEMRWRIVVQHVVKNETTKVGTLTTFATLWAAVTTKAVGETLEDGTIASRIDYTFRVRRRDDITPAMKIVFVGKTLQVDSVRLVDATYMELIARGKS